MKIAYLPYTAKVEIESAVSDFDEDVAIMKTRMQIDKFLVHFETVGGMKVTAKLKEVK